MQRSGIMTAAGLVAAISSAVPAGAQDLQWEVLNPFRFYKNASAFQLHEDAFKAVGGDRPDADRSQHVRNIERCLNDPATTDTSIRAACLAIVQRYVKQPRLGWASATLEDTCYDRVPRPRRYPAACEREAAGDRVAEDYILPGAHSVSIALAPARRAEAAAGQCSWSWKPRVGGEWIKAQPQPCIERMVIKRVPYARDRAVSGVEVKVDLPGGRTLSDIVVVEDLLIVALGDSFASGEGNPDKPVTFSASRALDYRPPRRDPATANVATFSKGVLRALSADTIKYDSFILPRRYMRDEQQGGKQFAFDSEEFRHAFWERSAHWLSPDCHRSQYAFPTRVGLQLALEDRRRAVTLIQLACSGAEVTRGLFQKLDAREHYEESRVRTREVPPQLDQLTRLICSVDARVDSAAYPLLEGRRGAGQRSEAIRMQWCPPDKRKRDIDLVLLSIGGNDIGFSQLVAYTFLDHARDIAPLLGLAERQIRFGPDVANAHLNRLDTRMEAVRSALDTGFGVDASKVIHAAYENVEYDEDGNFCGDPQRAALGMDVHAKFKINAARVKEVNAFLVRLFDRIECVTDASAKPNCPAGLKTGAGTKFNLVVEHQPEFLRRGICARDPERRAEDTLMMRMPRIPVGSTSATFWPYSPAAYRPYAHRTRLFRTPNDAFLTANEHREATGLFDILQPAVAALISGAFHPTAEAHAIVADHVMHHARRILERSVAR
jgi:lysophospholipase L1-like esterase